MKKVNIKPSKFASLLGFVGGLVFCCLGVFFLIQNLDIIGIIWTIIAFLITIYYAINLFTKKGISLYQVTVEDTDKKKKK